MWAVQGDIGSKIILTPSRPRQESVLDGSAAASGAAAPQGAGAAQPTARTRGGSTSSTSKKDGPPVIVRQASAYATMPPAVASASSASPAPPTATELTPQNQSSVSGPASSASSELGSPAPSPTSKLAHEASSGSGSASTATPGPVTAEAYAEAEERADKARKAGDSATQAKLSRVLSKQTTSAVLTTLRAISHRAAADMERWRVTVGKGQEDDLLSYWAAWAAHMTGVKRTNERLLAYTRASAAAAASYAAAMDSAASVLAPVASGEVMTVLPSELQASELSSALAHASGTGGASAVAHAAERSMQTSTSAGVAAANKQAAAAQSAGARRMASFSGGGGSATLPPPPPPSASAGGAAAGGPAGGALAISSVASALVDLHAQVSRAAGEVAADVSRDVCGDSDGPLGRKGDGRTHAEVKLPMGASKLSAAMADGTAAAPRSLGELCAWYDALAGELLRDGNMLADMLSETAEACGGAYASFEGATHAMITGSKLYKGKDLWAEELRYRRCVRLLLAAKARYLAGMAGLFERYRRIEAMRSESLSVAVEKYAAVVSRAFERVTAKAASESVASGSLTTHADFCRTVEGDAKRRIELMRAAAASARSHADAAAAAAASAAAGQATAQAQAHAAAAGEAYVGYSSATSNGGATMTAQQHLRFSMEAAPASISPLCSPLVARVGLVYRQSGIIKQWKPALAVLTRDAYLHIFALPDGVAVPGTGGGASATAPGPGPSTVVAGGGSTAHSNETGTHPEVLSAIARWSVDRASGAPLPRELSTAASPSPPEDGSSSSAALLPLPPPAMPGGLISLCAAFSVNVGDLSALPDIASAVRGVASEPPTQHSYALSPATRVEPAASMHAHALELSDKAGWFGSTRLPFRCLSSSDAAEWRSALLAMVEQVGVLAANAQA